MLTYPESISPYVYRSAFEKSCEHDLKRKGEGAFAFYEIDQIWGYENLNRENYYKALLRTQGNAYVANRYLDRAHEVGLALVRRGGILNKERISCRMIRNSRKTKEELFLYLIKKGFLIDPQKFCDPAANYRPAVWG
jgi:hypothetical protein